MPIMPYCSPSFSRKARPRSRYRRSRPARRRVALAISMASSSVSNRKTGARGPKISSVANRSSPAWPRSRWSARRRCRPACRAAAGGDLAALVARVGDELLDLLDRVRVDHRALLDPVLAPVADLQRLGRGASASRRRRHGRPPARRCGWRRRRSGPHCGTSTPSRPRPPRPDRHRRRRGRARCRPAPSRPS